MDAVAGWYPDPESGEPERLRYWDGERWTEHRYQEGSTAPMLPDGEWPEGWYPDPDSEEPNHLRYWDGTAWTEHRAEEGEQGLTVRDSQPESAGRWNSLMKDLDRVEQSVRRKRDEKRQARELREAEIQQNYGVLTASGNFGNRNIKFYDKGYVQIAMPFSKGDFERLISIEAKANVTKKTAPGRAAMAMVTLGANLLTSGTVRGDVYLTIQTDKQTHVLHEQAIAALQVQSALTLEAAGRALLERTREDSQTEASSPAGNAQSHHLTLGDRLRELETAHSEGLMSDDEYSEVRQRLMNEY